MQALGYPAVKDLVFVGGGHAHALVLRAWAMRPLPGVRLTLINPGSAAPYTGMLPGLHGKPVDTLSVGALSPELGLVVGVHLLIYDLDDLRGALRPDVRGRSPRGDAAAVRQLLEPDL